jgi:uncharacterized sulfatase
MKSKKDTVIMDTGFKPDYAILKKYSKFRTDFKADSLEYPLMRKNDVPDHLSHFFTFKNKKPNIVIIIVESLGSDYSGKDAYLGSYTPFLDSLEKRSLYWPNCLASSQRTFAVLPSVLGSLPHGIKGFQFGNMPDHLSLLKICKQNGYFTNFFYSGYTDFDCMTLFLYAEGTDFIAPLYQEYEKDKTGQSTDWGFDDKILFRKSLDYLSKETVQQQINVFLTISTHSPLNNDEKEHYLKKAQTIYNKLPLNIQNRDNGALPFLSTFLYTDDAIKGFIESYKKRKDFENTIFIITGDHGIEMNPKNELTKYHVPLIIYSPLLNSYRKFNAVVSSLDITPSIVAVLEGNHFIQKSNFISWVGKSLDTSKNFRHQGYNLFMLSSRLKSEYCESNYFLSFDKLFSFDSLMNFKIVDDNILKNKIVDNYNNACYVDKYVYLKNRLIKPQFRLK